MIKISQKICYPYGKKYEYTYGTQILVTILESESDTKIIVPGFKGYEGEDGLYTEIMNESKFLDKYSWEYFDNR
jgi:hypothetical protein